MKVYYDIEDMLEDELKRLGKKEDISPSDLENMYKIVDILKDITTIEAMRKSEEEGYSRDSSYNSYDSYDNYSNYSNNSYGRRGRDGDGDGRYSENSYRRGRDSMGRYTSRDRGSYRNGGSSNDYSGHTKEQMVKKLEKMMRETDDEQERDNIIRAIEQLER